METVADLRFNAWSPNPKINMLSPLFSRIDIQIKIIYDAHREKTPLLCFSLYL